MRRWAAWAFLISAVAPATSQVSYERLLKAEPADWLTYSGPYNAQRHSLLKQVHTGNVRALVPQWIYHVPGASRLQSVTKRVRISVSSRGPAAHFRIGSWRIL